MPKQKSIPVALLVVVALGIAAAYLVVESGKRTREAERLERSDSAREETAAILAGPAAPSTKRNQPDSPNLLVIFADDLGYGDVGFHGCPDIPTPHIDSLAERGVVCTSGYATHPWCSPSRAGLLAGRYQHRFGFENNPAWKPEDPNEGFPPEVETLAEALGDAGYITGIVGKWHLGGHENHHPMNRGFHEFFGFLGGSNPYLPEEKRKEGVEHRLPLQRGFEMVEEEDYLTDAFSREAASFISESREHPWFLYLAYSAPHAPLQATSEYLTRVSHIEDERRRVYAAMVVAMDDGIGRVEAALRSTGQMENTLLFFVNDNGGNIRTAQCSNEPLAGEKGSLLEGGIRVPFVVSWPGTLPTGIRFDAPVSTLDIFATAVDVSGSAPEKQRDLDGTNLIPFLEGREEGKPHERLFWRIGGGKGFAVREGKWKLVTGERGPGRLYDLEEDIGETKNLVRKFPDIADRLRAALEEWNSGNVPPKFGTEK